MITIIFFLLVISTTLDAANYGEKLKLRCPLTNLNTEVSWLKNGKIIDFSANKHYSLRRNGQVLKFKKLLWNDAGLYSCIDNKDKKVLVVHNVSLQANKRKLCKKPCFKYPSKVNKTLHRVELVGSNVELTCAVDGELPIRYIWYKNDKVERIRRFGSPLVTNQPVLKLHNLAITDSGNYKCRAGNRHGSISNTIHLHVQQRLQFVPYVGKMSMENQTRFVGENVSIGCYELTAKSKPDIIWLKLKSTANTTLFQKYDTIEALKSGMYEDIAEVIPEELYRPIMKKYSPGNMVHGVELRLFNASKEDSGYYTCIAINYLGIGYESMYLNIKERAD